MEPIQKISLKSKHPWHKPERKHTSRKTPPSIYDKNIILCGKPVAFENRAILQNYAAIRMPKDFIEHTLSETSTLSFIGIRPQQLFSNNHLSFTLALNWTFHIISNENIVNITKIAKPLIQRISPQSKILREEAFKKPDGNISILYFTTQTGEAVYMNLMFFASIENRLLIGSITFHSQDADRICPIALEMAKSFHLTQN